MCQCSIFVTVGELNVICIWEAASSQSAQRTWRAHRLRSDPLYVAGEWCGQVTCRASLGLPQMVCFLKKTNVNTSWYIKFKLILTLKQNLRSNSDVFRAKYEVVLCSRCTPTVCFLCIYTHIYGDTCIGFPFLSFLACLCKWNGVMSCDLAFSH